MFVMSKTPYRVSFFGGGTDFPDYYLDHGGAVLSTSIDKYCYLSARILPPFFSNLHRVVWSHIENVSTYKDILHPAVRNGLHYLGIEDKVGLEIHYQGDLPARTGMGSSSAFVVGLFNTLSALKGTPWNKKKLCLEAIEFERNILKDVVGCQDQVAVTNGGLNLIEFNTDGTIKSQKVNINESRKEELESNILFLYTGENRSSSEIQKSLIRNISNNKDNLFNLKQLSYEGKNILQGQGPLEEFGQLLHEAWKIKKQVNPSVSSSRVDEIYQEAIKHGALGGKILGAGQAGFMIFYVPKNCRAKVEKALKNFLIVPFSLEELGTHIVMTNRPIN